MRYSKSPSYKKNILNEVRENFLDFVFKNMRTIGDFKSYSE